MQNKDLNLNIFELFLSWVITIIRQICRFVTVCITVFIILYMKKIFEYICHYILIKIWHFKFLTIPIIKYIWVEGSYSTCMTKYTFSYKYYQRSTETYFIIGIFKNLFILLNVTINKTYIIARHMKTIYFINSRSLKTHIYVFPNVHIYTNKRILKTSSLRKRFL